MNQKGTVLVAAAILSLIWGGIETKAQIVDGVKNDLWDLSQGTVVTATSGNLGSSTQLGMFGGGVGGNDIALYTYFSDKSNGYSHFVEWRTPAPVTVTQIRLYASGDGATYNNQREFGQFTLKIKSPGSTTFDQTVLTFVPTHPYTEISPQFILDTNITAITAQQFRAEFTQINLGGFNGPRIIELDAFGPPDTTPPTVTITPVPEQGASGSAMFLSGTVTDNVGVTSARWERNGVAMGPVTLTSGNFNFLAPLVAGENILKVIATDAKTNVGSAEISVRGYADGVIDDLFDVHQGTVLTANSGLQSSISAAGMLGGSDSGNFFETSIFSDDKPNAFVHYAEWRTANPVTVSQVRLYAAGDGTNYSHGRELNRFTLKAKSAGSSTYDLTLFSFTPSHPYGYLTNRLILDTNFTAVTAQEFRGEFEQINLRAEGWNAPRIIELDAFGPPPSPVPSIFKQPSDVSVLLGQNATFTVSAVGAAPLSYLWRRDGTNLNLSSRIQSPDGKTLNITAVTNSDIGSYSVLVTNEFGSVESLGATLSIISDTNAPIVTITSPIAGTSGIKNTALEGTLSDNYGVVSARWERNGTNMGSLVISNGLFTVRSITLTPGENRFKVIAADSTGNEGSAEVTVILSPTAQSDSDLWDVSRGIIVTADSGVWSEQGGPGLFGGGGFYGEVGDTIFADDKTNGFPHFVEWRTTNMVTVGKIRLFAGGDGQIYQFGREMGRFTLRTKSAGSSVFDTVVLSFVPQHPYPILDSESQLILETNVPPFTAREFRAEFEQINLRAEGYNGPRVIELDAFGPDISGPPTIITEPKPADGFVGSDVAFITAVTGSSPLVYQWQRDGSNLVESAKFVGVSSWMLNVRNLQPEDAGDYSVIVTNLLGQATSTNAHLTVSVDTNSPSITITSPNAGPQGNGTFTLSGNVSDANGIASVTYEHNGRVPKPLTLTNGNFSLNALTFDLGENRIKVSATDLSGNVGVAEVVATWTVPRAFVLGEPPVIQEGRTFTVPVILVSTGGVSGATFTLNFDTNYLSDVQVAWRSALDTAFTSSNLEGGKRLRATFALPGTTISSGSIPLADISFRARSVPTNIQTQLKLELVGVYSDTGDPFESGSSVVSTVAKINRRKFIGDNNANDLLDVGDASTILRLVNGIDIPRTWDRALNDLNRTGNVDPGDVIRVLRAVVELDPQPTNALSPAPLVGSYAKSIAKAASPVQLVPDKPSAAPGEKVTIEVRLADQTKPITGVSFRLDYPVEALRIPGASSHVLGSLVPTGAAQIWNVAPNQNNYTNQSGSIALGVSTPGAWPSSNGIIARVTFTVQDGAVGAQAWPVRLSNVVIGREGGSVESAAASDWSFVPRIPPPIKFSPAIQFIGQTPRLTLQGDLGANYRIEASSNLIDWQTVGTYASANGLVVVDDVAGAGATARFYRAVLIP